MQNVAGSTLVAMAMKFGLGAEIQSLTRLVDMLIYQYDQSVRETETKEVQKTKAMVITHCYQYVVHDQHCVSVFAPP